MRTKNRLVIGLTIGFVGASLSLVVGCSGETADSGGGGGGGSGGAAPSGGVSGTSGAPSGGTAGAATGGVSTGGVSGAGVTGGSGALAGAGTGGAGTSSGGTGGAGNGGAVTGGAGSGGSMAGTGGSGGSGGTSGTGGSAGAGSFTLTSPDHANGAMFADPYTCAEAGFDGSILPELRWSGAPAGTMSFAITFIDRTLAPANANGYHWVIWNIPATTMSLPEGFKDQASIGAQENRDFLGPCPNFGGGSANTDTYEFTIYALSQASITVMGTGTTAVRNAETALEANNLAKAKLSGTSNASP
jgi:phosphatidylethanolamine-binding protein (PEBP) family uncharacterized protein